jgi:hypothetical protein
MPLVKSFTLTVLAAPTRLSDVYGDGPNVVNAANDIPYRELLLQTETADTKIGDSNITTTNYGTLIAATGTPVVAIGPWETGPIKLSEIWAIGGGTGKLHILGVPY